MKMPIRFGASLAAAVMALGLVAVRAQAPYVYAITGARLVTVSGATIPSGTIVLRNGLIEAVGAGVQTPADAVKIDGTGLTVYPGLIDMGTSTGLDVQVPSEAPENIREADDLERWKRGVILRPNLMAAEHVKQTTPDLGRMAATGITTVLAVPPGTIFKGQSALMNVMGADPRPIVGAIAEPVSGTAIVKAPVALHVGMPNGVRVGDAYPDSLLGVIAFIRQSFIDGQYQQMLEQRYQKSPAGQPRPAFDPALDALQPALDRRLPVAFEAELAREILRGLRMAKEFNLDPIVVGGWEADQVEADLKAQRARVIYSLDFPTRSKALAPDAPEPARELRLRAQAPKTPAALQQAGITFAFSSDGLDKPQDFIANAAKTVKAGLPADAAIRALTLNAATIAGAADRLGSLDRGKIANLVVTDGDLLADGTHVKQVFIDGRMIDLAPLTEGSGPQRRGRGAR
ncbi:MAG TPA: amidohydrolase family protein [Vicinamibacterales bacterium]|nr:amidohydrolase family protein [Vicinamibacterales bacterium]